MRARVRHIRKRTLNHPPHPHPQTHTPRINTCVKACSVEDIKLPCQNFSKVNALYIVYLLHEVTTPNILLRIVARRPLAVLLATALSNIPVVDICLCVCVCVRERERARARERERALAVSSLHAFRQVELKSIPDIKHIILSFAIYWFLPVELESTPDIQHICEQL